MQGGFIRESVAGRYYFLPLGIRVSDKMIKVVEEEMNAAGAQKLITPVLHPLELWEETNRTRSAGFELMTVKDQRGARFALGGTAEEMMVDLVRKFTVSYKDLPFNIYQFSPKFRDERRARGGLLRTREFIMKDAYSFHCDKEDFEKEYENMGNTYKRIFKRVGLNTMVVESDNGYIGGEYCHEFVVESDIGETKFLTTDDGSYAAHEDVAKFDRGEVNAKEKEKPFEIVEQPEWVQSMEDNEKHYKLPKSHFLKNVVYKNRVTGEILIAVIRGDLEVNKTKLERALNLVGELEDATVDDLKKLGTKPGYVHSWGHKGARYIGDISLESVKNFIGGQKEEKTDSINVNYGRDFKCEVLADIALAPEDAATAGSKKKLTARRGIEVGNIFQLGTHYSSKMAGAVFMDKDNTEKPYYMGCYGIGIGRTIAAVLEIHHDDKGIIWPLSIAPFTIHMTTLGSGTSPEIRERGDKLYQELTAAGYEVLYDDRDEHAGTKLNDADLIGIPLRLVLSKKTLEKQGVEWKLRTEKEARIVTFDQLVKEIDAFIDASR